MLRRLLVALALGVTQLAVVGSALAQNAEIGTAITLDGRAPSASGELTGDSGGAFRYFQIDYPGGSTPVAITMRAQPGRGTAGVGTGFKIYGPAGLVGDAFGDDRSEADSGYALSIANANPGRYHIQVYNFIHGLPMRYQLRVSGLPAAPVAGPVIADAPSAPGPAAPAAGATADRPASVGSTSLTTGGVLAAGSGGSFNYYELQYPGGRSRLTITIGYSPVTPISEQAVGFNLYRPDPDAPGGSRLVGSSAETGRNESSATEVFALEAEDAETYLLQVFSYLPEAPLNYTLIVTGLSGPIAEVSGHTDPSRAVVLNASTIAARATLEGSPQGRFHYYTLQYPGADREVRLTVTFDAAPLAESEVGMNLWKAAERAGIAQGILSTRGKRVAILTIKEAEARDFGIQLFNYSQTGQTGRYLITVTGL